MSTQAVPSKDSDFDQVSGLAVENSTQYATKWEIPQTEVTTLSDSHIAWHAAFEKARDPATRTEGTVAAKDTARDAHLDVRGEMGDWSPIGSVIIPGRKV
ncbi:MAG: hypothetical protein LBL04_09455 [Bacteroidales bacterium]|jgi:hypothetical protein|nr:hypothetical protein [Bacteroidales bacterium]